MAGFKVVLAITVLLTVLSLAAAQVSFGFNPGFGGVGGYSGYNGYDNGYGQPGYNGYQGYGSPGYNGYQGYGRPGYNGYGRPNGGGFGFNINRR